MRLLGLGQVKEREAYEALDWLLDRQKRIENGLARRHLQDGVLVLYDVSSSYFEGRCCPLAHHGHSRDHRGDRLQIVYGLLCTREGLPIAVEVFDGNTADPSTLSAQVEKIKDRFGISRVVLVGDRGMITSARIRDDLKPAGLDWITCLRAPAIQALAAENGPLQLSLFDDRDLAEISAPELFPGERLIVCRNRDLAAERARKREDLLVATERELTRVQEQVRRKNSRLKSAAEIGMAVGAVIEAGKWPSTSPSRSVTVISHSSGGPFRSRKKLGSTASMSSAPACRPRISAPQKRSRPTRICRGSNAPSDA